MKKIYILFLALSIVGIVSAQTKQVRFLNSDVKSSKSFISSDLSQIKSTNATLNENFDATTFPPASWSVTGVADMWLSSSDPSIVAWEAASLPTVHCATADCWNTAAGDEASLITPVLHPTAGSNTLSYSVNCFELNVAWAGSGPQLFIEFSTDGGTTWTTSTTNVLATLPNYNTASTDWQPLTADLSAYNGGSVQVRFRAVSDYGGFSIGLEDVTGPEADITLPTAADNVVVADPQNAMTPLEHAMFAFSADVTNVGADLSTPTNLDITANPGGYSDAVAITMPLVYGATENVASTNYFAPTAVGAYSATFTATVAGDANPADNTSTIDFAVSDSTWAADNDSPLGAIGSNSGTITFGNIYLVLANDFITSVSVGFGNVTANQDFTLSLYSLDAGTGVATLVYTTPTLTKTVAMANSIATFKIVDQAVTPGLYVIAINQLTATNIAVLYDDNGGTLYLVNTGTGAVSMNTSFGDAFIRMNNGLITNIKPVEFGGISVYPNPASDNLTIVNAPNSTVEVYNLVGEMVYSQSNVMSNVDLSGIVNGSYIVKVTTNKGVYNQKINIVR